VSETPNNVYRLDDYRQQRAGAAEFDNSTDVAFHEARKDLLSLEEARRLAISTDMFVKKPLETLSFSEQAIRYIASVSVNIEAARIDMMGYRNNVSQNKSDYDLAA